MLPDDTTTHTHRATPKDEPAWSIPPLILGRTAQAAVAPAQHLPIGARLGEHTVTEPRGRDGCFDVHVVTHAERGSLHMARVLRREHTGLAPAILASASQIQHHPHRNLRAVLETGWTDEPTPRAFIVHERLVGRSLATLVIGGSGIEWPLVVAIGLQCAEALEALHQCGLAHTHLALDSAALMHVAGDQFRVVFGGLEHAQAITPGAVAEEEPRVRDDLLALGGMLVALAASTASPAAPVPEVLTALLTRMVDPRPAIRPSSAGEIHDQLNAIHDHVDPQLSSVRMLGEAFRRIAHDDFEVLIELDEPTPIAPAAPITSITPIAPIVPVIVALLPAPAARWPTLLLVAVVAVVAFAAGRSLPDRGEPVAAQTLTPTADEAPAPIALRRIPDQSLAPVPVLLPRARVARVQPPRSEPAGPDPAPPSPDLAPAEPGAVESGVAQAPAEDPSDQDSILLPIPVGADRQGEDSAAP